MVKLSNLEKHIVVEEFTSMAIISLKSAIGAMAEVMAGKSAKAVENYRLYTINNRMNQKLVGC